jgi:hypothetical protein
VEVSKIAIQAAAPATRWGSTCEPYGNQPVYLDDLHVAIAELRFQLVDTINVLRTRGWLYTASLSQIS